MREMGMSDRNRFEDLTASAQLKKQLEQGSSVSALQRQIEDQGIERLRKMFDELQKGRVARQEPSLQTGLAEAVSRLFSPYLALVEFGQKYGREIVTGITRLIEPLERIRAALAAIPVDDLRAYAERLSRFNEEFWQQLDQNERDTYALLGRLGLTSLETVLTYEDVINILNLQRTQGDQAALNYILEKLRAREYEVLNEMVEGWYTVSYMSARRRLITSAINAHKRSEYDLSIPTLLPLIDGLTQEIAATLPTPGKKLIKVKHVALEYSKIEPELSSECLVQVVDQIIFRDVDLRQPHALTTSNNRHGILHGRVADYGTELHSYQIMFLLNMTVAVYQRLVPANMAPSVTGP
jgi:hypothetical protein